MLKSDSVADSETQGAALPPVSAVEFRPGDPGDDICELEDTGAVAFPVRDLEFVRMTFVDLGRVPFVPGSHEEYER